MGSSAVLQQMILRDTFEATASAISIDAKRSGITWPYYLTPFYELYAGQALNRSQAEVCALFTFVEGDGRDSWIEFSTENHLDWTRNGHMSKYGNLDRMNGSNYHEDIIRNTEDGWASDDIRSEYWTMWLYSPPPIQFASINWNVIAVPDFEIMVDAMKVLRGESVVTSVRPTISTGTAFTEEEHDRMHSQLETGSQADHPHSFLWTPIYEDPDDVNSKFVAFLAAGFAWDVSLRDLLPSNVEGVMAVVSNTCNQTYTYEISGRDAFYLGEGDLHDRKYDSERKSHDLSLLTHPMKDSVKGDCRYTMVSSLCEPDSLDYYLQSWALMIYNIQF